MKRFAIALAAGTALAAAGCASTPPPRYYTLSAELPQAAAAQGPSISVNATVPATLDRPQFVVAVNANEVAVLEQRRWSEPLAGEIGRVIAENLSRATGNPRVAAYPQSSSLNAGYRVSVDVQRFVGRLDGDAIVEALWSVRGPKGDVLHSGRARVQETTGKTYDSLVAAYSHALAKVSGEIAAALKGLPPARR
jgi:uncharacterized lipoprotein YmbA